MLFLLNDSVTLTPSSRKASSAGVGRKSDTTRTSPSGSFLYLVFAVIDRLASAPISGADDANHVAPISKTDSENSTLNLAETVKPLFGLAVTEISRDDAMRIGKR